MQKWDEQCRLWAIKYFHHRPFQSLQQWHNQTPLLVVAHAPFAKKLSDEITWTWFSWKNLRSYAKGWALLLGYVYMLHFNTPLNSQKLRLQGFHSQTKTALPPSGQFTINLLSQTQSNLELTPPRIKQNIIFLYLHFYCSSQFRSRVFVSQIINLKFVHYLGGFY